MHEWQSRVPRDRYERRRQRLLDHIAECETALGRRNRRIAEMGKHVQSLTTENADIRKRLMPEGMEWPCFEDGEPVKFGDMALIDGEADMVEAVQLWIHGKPVIYGDGGSQQLERGERVRRPVADTWERLEEDAGKEACEYFADMPCGCETSEMLDETVEKCNAAKARDLVPRAKALAGLSE